ncbi:Kae1-associated kinase Bud32 [Candidatus Pacearchaeota archaeon CG10_big_fil_rev_8_21_14_0_10_32_42]|nr:MAG: Kae1-associated kinase Bud32 [Candidatus Pacearchaeota archaeon CG10_big_fil_rev_8_21_14_0_10_32_42]
MKKIISSGAEAVIYLEGDQVIKTRLSKGYRIKEIDSKIIKRRTKAEIKILKKASELTNVPKPEELKSENEIFIPYIEGDKLSEKLNSYVEERQKEVMEKVGKEIGKLHEAGIIHGDLTTSNMILKENEVYIIDFGLGSLNGKYEQKGVDVHLLKQALEAKHFESCKKLFSWFKFGYGSIDKSEAKKVFERLEEIERRGRYRH